MQKKIGRLTSLSTNPSKQNTSKLKLMIGKDNVKTVLQNLRVKIAARSKCVRNMKLKKLKF